MAAASTTTSRPRRRRRGRVWIPVVLVVVLLVGGYGAADAADVVPGVLTVRPVPAANPPYPSADAVELGVPDGVPGPDEAAALPEPDGVQALVGDLLGDPAIAGSTGVMVVDVLTGDPLGAANADVPHAPASTAKLLTATAAIATAGPDAVFTTRVMQSEPGVVVLVGGGDLTLAPGAGDPDAVIGRGGIGDLAEQTALALAESGETSVSVQLDTSYYAGPELAARWDEIDLSVGDAMFMAPLAIDIGRLEGQRARAVDPAGAVAAEFVESLAEAGIAVEGAVTDGVAAPDATELASVSSAPLEDLVAYALQASENILTEGLGRLVAHEQGEEPSFAGAGAAVRDALADLGVDVAGLELIDTSGLSGTSRVAPQTLISTLLTIAEHPRLGSVARGLPVAGLEGTLSDRLREPPAAGLVAAKTGTLRTVVALSGYATTADGRLLAFAVMAGDLPLGGTGPARSAVDTFAQSLATCGC
jgi:serine-type D-Ala-D-Ala carboxypeptidase/endopeptidase (penicillin-binding protein 4)